MKTKDNRGFDPTKKKLLWLIKSFNAFYNLRHGKILGKTVEHSGNPIVRKLYSISQEVCQDVKDHKYFNQHKYADHDRYRRILMQPIEFGLGVYYTDSAWRDIGDVLLYKLLLAKDELMPLLEKNIKDPKHWYFNVWEDFQEETIKLQDQGDLQKGLVSDSESYLVDSAGERRIKDINEQKRRREEKHSHW